MFISQSPVSPREKTCVYSSRVLGNIGSSARQLDFAVGDVDVCGFGEGIVMDSEAQSVRYGSGTCSGVPGAPSGTGNSRDVKGGSFGAHDRIGLRNGHFEETSPTVDCDFMVVDAVLHPSQSEPRPLPPTPPAATVNNRLRPSNQPFISVHLVDLGSFKSVTEFVRYWIHHGLQRFVHNVQIRKRWPQSMQQKWSRYFRFYKLLDLERAERIRGQPDMTGNSALMEVAGQMDHVRVVRGIKSLPKFVDFLRQESGDVVSCNRECNGNRRRF